MDGKKPFGLIIPKKSPAVRPKSGGIFGSDSDDDSTSKKKISTISQSKPPKTTHKKEDVDPSIYEYDSIYDDMKAQKAAEVAPKVQKSSRYIDHLLKAADKRKKEYERRVEKKVQLEREKEGDEFKDKEMFVSATYKKKLQEREEEEERERREQMLNDMMDVTKQKDLSGFYRHFLKQSVGEESIPVFGERTVKKEKSSDPESEQIESSKANASSGLDGFDDRDITDDDSSDESSGDKEGGNSYEKSMRVYLEEPEKTKSARVTPEELNCDDKNSKSLSRKGSKEEHSNAEKCIQTATKAASGRNETSRIRKRNSESSVSEEESHSSVKKSKLANKLNPEVSTNKETVHRRRTRLDSDSSEASDSEIHEQKNSKHDSDLLPLNGVDKNNAVDKSDMCKKSRNIFEKRTVGEVFSVAQARYFQRLATRCG